MPGLRPCPQGCPLPGNGPDHAGTVGGVPAHGMSPIPVSLLTLPYLWSSQTFSRSSISHPAAPFVFLVPSTKAPNIFQQCHPQSLHKKNHFLCLPTPLPGDFGQPAAPFPPSLPLLPTCSRIPGSCLCRAVSTAVIKAFKKGEQQQQQKKTGVCLFLPLGRATCFIGTGIYGHINVELLLPP